jgi:2-phospho-L-lactate guanylyltransferase
MTERLRTCALIPMKAFGEAKTRLRGRLDDASRRHLARAMFERVLAAVRDSGAIDAVYVITNGDDVASVVRDAGGQLLGDPEPRRASLGALIDWGLAELLRAGTSRAVVLMADLPCATAADVLSVCVALESSDVVLVADRRGRSTNALGVQLPWNTTTAFGDPRSYALHLESAQALGLRACELTNARLAHDVDTPDDLPAQGCEWYPQLAP